MSKKCVAFSKSKLGLETADNRKAFYAGWDAAMLEALAAPVRTKDLTDDEVEAIVDSVGAHEVGCWQHVFARAVIAADRDKNK